MIVTYDKSFEKSLSRIKDIAILTRIEKAITNLERIGTLSESKGIVRLTGFNKYYRIRIGDYRLGFEKVTEGKIKLIIIAHRKDIYNQFPF